jgi:hypothetical protein
MWDPQHLTTLQASTACYGIAYHYLLFQLKFSAVFNWQCKGYSLTNLLRHLTHAAPVNMTMQINMDTHARTDAGYEYATQVPSQ